MSEQFIITFAEVAWTLTKVCNGQTQTASIAIPAEASLAEQVGALKEHLASVGYSGQPAVLTLPSSWCLCAPISTKDLERRQHRREMAFRLEEHLPVSAEDVVADFVNAADGQAIGVCCELSRLEPLVGALEESGIAIKHICPAALLAADYVLAQHPRLAAVVIGSQAAQGQTHSTSYDLIEFQDGKPASWSWLANDAAAVRDRLSGLKALQEDAGHLAFVGCREVFCRDNSGWDSRSVDVQAAGAQEATDRQGAKVLEESACPWIDFRRDKLASAHGDSGGRKAVAALVWATVGLLVCLSGVMQLRGRQYDQHTQQCMRQQVEVFKAAMPGQRVPVDIKGRLLSERRKLVAKGQGGGADTQAVMGTSALVLFRDVLAGLPGDIRYRITNLDIQKNVISVKGQARSYIEADRLAAGLRQSGRLDVDPPRTQAIKGSGVEFVFTAKPRASSSESKDVQ